MAKRLKYSRWRRLPGVYRFHERKPPDLDREDQRISLYLPSGLLELATEFATSAGTTLQSYCEQLLTQAIDQERIRRLVSEQEARHGTLEGLHAIADDPVYLAEWKAVVTQPARPDEPPSTVKPMPGSTCDEHTALLGPRFLFAPTTAPPVGPEAPPMPAESPSPATIVLRHAGLGEFDDPSGLLPCLRRGEGIGPAAARELLGALEALEEEFEGQATMSRRLAYALHRLAFEGQVLLTDAWPMGTEDTATVDVLRLVQEGVDRVLSGEDIRYYPRHNGPELTS